MALRVAHHLIIGLIQCDPHLHMGTEFSVAESGVVREGLWSLPEEKWRCSIVYDHCIIDDNPNIVATGLRDTSLLSDITIVRCFVSTWFYLFHTITNVLPAAPAQRLYGLAVYIMDQLITLIGCHDDHDNGHPRGRHTEEEGRGMGPPETDGGEI